MADQDSYLDTAGGLQQVPDVNVTEKPEQPYIATDGSMQSALAVNVLSGGIPANGVPLVEGETVDVLSADGSTQLAQGTADIDTTTDPNTLNGIDLPANYAVTQDQASGIVVNQYDDTGSFAMIAAVSNNQLSFTLSNATTRIAVNAGPATVEAGGKTADITFAIDQGVFGDFPFANSDVTLLISADSIPIVNSDGTAVTAPATASVANNALVNVTLAETDYVVQNQQPITVENSPHSKSVTGTVGISGGVLNGVGLNATTAIVEDQDTLQVPVTGTYTDTITPTVAGGVITGFVLS